MEDESYRLVPAYPVKRGLKIGTAVSPDQIAAVASVYDNLPEGSRPSQAGTAAEASQVHQRRPHRRATAELMGFGTC